MRKLPRFGTSDRKDNRQLPGDRKGCPRDGDITHPHRGRIRRETEPALPYLGGISFTPYKEEYKSLIPSDKMHYMETYNASEGFFRFGCRICKK